MNDEVVKEEEEEVVEEGIVVLFLKDFPEKVIENPQKLTRPNQENDRAKGV